MTAISTAFLSRFRSRTLCAGLVALMAWSGPGVAQPVGIPSMGAASSVELSPALERTLGDAIMEQGRRDPTYVADPDVSQYLTDMGRKLAAHAPGGVNQRITIFGVRDPQINAFALPGGYIGVNSGLLVSAQSESELASVIAHEIGHVSQRHIARGMTQQEQSSHVVIAALAGALLAALSGSSDLAMGVAAFGQAAAVDQQLGFSRQAEQEADRAGFEMLSKAGFDPRGMVRMFEQLGNASRLNEGSGGGYTSTHPLSIQRMSDIQNRVAKLPNKPVPSSDSFWYVRAKLRVLQARSSVPLRNALDKLNFDASKKAGVEQSAAWYGLAYAAWQKQDLTEARRLLGLAQQHGNTSPEIATLAVAVALDGGNTSEALSLSQQARSRWPNSQGVALARTEALQKTGQDAPAAELLAQLIKAWPEVPRFHQLQAQSYERLGKSIQARRAMASYYELTGALPAAVTQLEQARGLTKDFYEQSQLDVRIRTLKERLQSDRQLLERFKS